MSKGVRGSVPALVFAAGLLAGPAAVAQETEAADEAVLRGEYVFRAAGCYGCHTDVKNKGPALAGGRPLKTPFGTFYGPNITPHKEHGIGGWTFEEFRAALRRGVAPDGSPYYPAFPYPSFTGMSDRDVADLWAYLQTVEPVDRPDEAHALGFPYGLRWLNSVWQALYFEPARFEAGEPPDGVEDGEAWRRGAYLVHAVAHCGECHTPRGVLGAPDGDLALAGNADGPDGDPAPNITPHDGTGIGDWSLGDITSYLKIGMLPDGDFAGSAMAEVIEHSTGRMTDADRRAIAVYLLSLPPVERRISKKK
ncbi:MAG TPA: c-type cytochrome [Alphaproteobacteria bacterium]|nr:c-type cytochrome [Alphaproteobacteria bacterium]